MALQKTNGLTVDVKSALSEGYRLVIGYLVLALAYILVSDTILGALIKNPDLIVRASLYKGWAFSVGSAILLAVLVRRLILRRLSKEGELNSLIQSIPDLIWMKDLNGHYVSGNSAFFKALGRPEHEVIGYRIEDISDSDQNRRIADLDVTIQETGLPIHWVETICTSDGKATYHSVSKVPIRDHTGAITGILGISRNITEHKVMEESLRSSEQQFRAVVESSPNGILMIDESGRITLINKEIERAFGYSRRELIGKPVEILIPKAQRPAHAHLHDDFTDVSRSWQLSFGDEIFGLRKDGSEFPVEVGLTPVNTGMATYVLATVSDLSEQAIAEEKIRKLALFDDLTSLPNRNLFTQQLEVALAQSAVAGTKLSVLAVNLDRFKAINDTLGHDTGDQLLRDVASRLQETLRERDFLARLGGDDFVVIAPNTSDLASLANKILATINKPTTIAGREYRVTAGIGVSSYPFDATDAAELQRCADVALGYAKEKGHGSFEFYSEMLEQRTARRLAIEAGLRGALDRGEFTLNFQPIVDLETGRVAGAEALLRWHHPELGNVPPDQFIPIAEETLMILPIGAWVMRESCAAAGRWLAEGKQLDYISVNLSPGQLHDPNLFETISSSLEDAGLTADQLQLEITEGMVMEDPDAAIALLKQLKEQGMSIAMDDFGTGYSSLAYLKRLPIDRIKIDRSFVQDIPTDSDSTAIVRSIVGLAKGLRRTLVAEGVETAEQMAFLENLGCESVQGYFFSRPVIEADFLNLCGHVFPVGASTLEQAA